MAEANLDNFPDSNHDDVKCNCDQNILFVQTFMNSKIGKEFEVYKTQMKSNLYGFNNVFNTDAPMDVKLRTLTEFCAVNCTIMGYDNVLGKIPITEYQPEDGEVLYAVLKFLHDFFGDHKDYLLEDEIKVQKFRGLYKNVFVLCQSLRQRVLQFEHGMMNGLSAFCSNQHVNTLIKPLSKHVERICSRDLNELFLIEI